MPPLVRQILLTLLGIIVGAMTNMATLKAGMMVVPFPAGFDPNTPEGIEGAMQQFTVANFIVPFLAHALGTLVGAFIAAKWSGTSSRLPALIVAATFFIGGVMMVMQIPSTPTWFMALDLVVAYFPMAYLAHAITTKRRLA
ncbi:MAG: hypothetical protein IPP80_05625 [Ignavibacteria bacterium]|nr:hypothetical protein [Ignavibacteria bacterium]MBL0321844.1 hypothetical protein [Ignavibacteria bacterium]